MIKTPDLIPKAGKVEKKHPQSTTFFIRSLANIKAGEKDGKRNEDGLIKKKKEKSTRK
jgi:hypothetical protein